MSLIKVITKTPERKWIMRLKIDQDQEVPTID